MERSRRLREAKDVYSSRQRTNGRITLSWLISHVRKLLVASQSWFVVSIVGEWVPQRHPYKLQSIRSCAGAGIGINAAIISIITEWLSDIKMGYCSDGWWLNQQFCCWELDGDEDSGCDSWHLWSTVSIARWFIYVLFAVRCYFPSFFHPFIRLYLFERTWADDIYQKAALSFVAARLVQALARYAAGSGISEIKCILSGFVMQGFLGFWTFLIKSLTLVSETTLVPFGGLIFLFSMYGMNSLS